MVASLKYLALLLTASLLFVCAAAGQQPSVLDSIDPGFCIIQPDEPAAVEIFADYNGRRFYFCCESCRTDFLSDPSRFDSLVPDADATDTTAAPNTWNADADPYADSFWGRIGRAINAIHAALRWVHVTFHLDDPVSMALAVITAGWIGLLAVSWVRTRKGSQLRPRLQTAALITLLLVPCFYADTLRRRLHHTSNAYKLSENDRLTMQTQYDEVLDRDAIHYATFFNFGIPPVPRPTELPPRLRRTYYRGNDERSDEMFNGGKYRTVTFDLSIEDSTGREIAAGSKVIDEQGQPAELFLLIRFVRSPDTSSGYFTDKYMQRMYVTMQADDFLGRDKPVEDRLQWTMTEHERVWEARYPLPRGVIVRTKGPHDSTHQIVRTIDPSDPAGRSGIVYLVEDRYKDDRVIGGRFHYAVQYELRTNDGIVLPSSTLWMQATYRGRNFADLQIADDEWLSAEPIPEK